MEQSRSRIGESVKSLPLVHRLGIPFSPSTQIYAEKMTAWMQQENRGEPESAARNEFWAEIDYQLLEAVINLIEETPEPVKAGRKEAESSIIAQKIQRELKAASALPADNVAPVLTPAKTVSEKGLDLIKSFEGLRLDAYCDTSGVWTIGYGHTGADVKQGQKISEAQAKELLRKDAAEAEQAVRELAKVSLNQSQFDALVSFTYNCGRGNLKRSTLLKKLNAGDYAGAQAAFNKFVCDANGTTLPGLVRRRREEAEMFGNQDK